MQRQLVKQNQREMELLSEVQKVRDDLVVERAAQAIRLKELESKVVLLQDRVEFEARERTYAEEKAANESI
jgi:hypothetical protein